MSRGGEQKRGERREKRRETKEGKETIHSYEQCAHCGSVCWAQNERLRENAIIKTVKTYLTPNLFCANTTCYLINPWRAWGLRYLICVSVTQHLTFHVISATNDTNLHIGRWRSKLLRDLLWKWFVAKLECFLLVRLHVKSAIFYSTENTHAYESGPRG